MPDGSAAARRVARASPRKALAVSVVDERGRPLPAAGLAAWLRRVAPPRARGAVSIALVSDRRIRALNRTYRRKDYATDVLSFPNPQFPVPSPQSPRLRSSTADRATAGPSVAPPARGRAVPSPCLGEIVIARGVAKRQARQARHSERTELRVLALHGLLHLLGYDHERDDGRMLRVERRLRRRGGLDSGLIERVGPADDAPRTAVRRPARRQPGRRRASR
jgi:probable rRNA maturation factor